MGVPPPVVKFSFVMFWANAYCLWVFFCAINPAKSVRRYHSKMHLHYSAVNSWLTNPTFPQSEIIYAKSKRSAFWASPTRDAQNAKNMGMGMPKTRGCPYHCDTASHFCPLRLRILWVLPAVNCLFLPFIVYRTLCGRASLFPPSLPSLSFPLPTHSRAVPFLCLLFSERERDCRE